MNDEKLKENISINHNKIMKKLVQIKEQELPIIAKFFSIDAFREIFWGRNITDEQYLEYKEIVNKIDLKKIDTKIEDIKELVNDYEQKTKNHWNEYNSSYKVYLNSKLENILKVLNENTFYNPGTGNIRYFVETYFNSYMQFININADKEPLEHFSYSGKNYIIFGKNGAGKTRLLNYIKDNYFNENAFVIPSDRNIKFGDLDSINMNYGERFFLSNIFKDKYILPNDLLTLFFKNKMMEELQQDGTSISQENGTRIAYSYKKLIEIFNSLGLERKIKLDINKNKFMLYNDEQDIKPYFITDGSDGEKSIIQFIVFVLLCPPNSFLFIDEPESHFNTALLNELFSLLEKERKDIVYIYCTHNIDFIELRENAQLVYLDKFDGKNWNIQEINSFEDISIESLINIIGTKKNLLFIESDKGNLDYKLYSALFDNYKIIPVASCEKVISNCKIINEGKFLNLNRKAHGIIDNDFREDDEIKKYKLEGIFTLTYNEIENMLLSSIIVEYIYKKHSLNKNIDNFKEAVINKAISGKKGIIQDFINKLYSKIQKKEHIKFDGNNENLKNTINNINRKNEDALLEKLNSFCDNLNNNLKDRNYDRIIKEYPNKGYISCISELGIDEDTYIYWILESIKVDKDFKDSIKKEFFLNYFN